MYLDYFGLNEAPCSITPDPTFIYLSQRHRDALAHLLYGVGQGGSGGFVQLTGEVGTGKTTLCRALLEQVPPGTRIALVLNPLLSPLEMLQAICEELGVSTEGALNSSKMLVDRLNAFLLQTHRDGERVVLVIDEAQNLSPESLEQVRLLTNLETSKEKLLQIILLGQPELRELLHRRNLRQLAQRITARYHLTPLSPNDTAAYVRHRLQVAGAERNPFRRSALKALYQRSQGVPRLINIIADRAMVGAYAAEKQDIDARLVHAAADEVQLGEPGVRRPRWPWLAAAVVAMGVAAAWWWLPGVLEWSTAPAPSTAQSAVVNEPALPDAAAARQPETPAGEAAVVDAPIPDAGLDVNTAGASEPEQQPQPAVATSLDELDPQWLPDQHEQAWQGLAGAWGAAGDGSLIAAACQGDDSQGYACLRDQGNWARLQRLDLPVVLVLQVPQASHVLLAAMADRELVLGTAPAALSLPREAVEPSWLGAYYVAWPQSPGWPREIKPGDTGPAVNALFEMAARVQPPYQGRRVFDAGFETWLRDFQVRSGLQPDGIVGPKTLLYLMRFSITEPSLAVSPANGD
jgi:general secretion pathway protein A